LEQDAGKYMQSANGGSLHVSPLTPAIGAIVENVDASAPLSEGALAEISSALDEHLVIFFRNQSLSPLQQRDFAAQLGSLYIHPFYPGHATAPEVMILAHDKEHRPNSDRWHHDVTYLENPARAAVLYAEDIPDVGGDTLWANMYLAYESLSRPMQRLVSRLRAVHSFAKNFSPARFEQLAMEHRREQLYAQHPPVSHPVARKNATTGRRALFVNADFTSHVEGLSQRESEWLLRFLFDHMAQPQFQVRWRWTPGDMAMWDNRWAQHCALADYYPMSRRVRRVTIVGDKPI
jgi:taurine dioxygenase